MRIYVAGSSKERERARRAMRAVREMGHAVSHDWLSVIERAGAANEGLSIEAQLRVAAGDLAAVDQSHLLWLLAPETESRGAWVEYGYALALGVQCIVSGPESGRSIFSRLAVAVLPSDDEAAEWIAGVEGTHHIRWTRSGGR